MNRDSAIALLHEYVQSESLRKHCYSVESAMRWYARHFEIAPEEVDLWGLTGLLHDFDYERYPSPTPPDGHPFKGVEILRSLGYPEVVLTAILGHAIYTGTARDTLMAKTLFAVDELCGLVTASVLVRPDRSVMTLEASSVRKKMKDKAFARGCNRDDILLGTEELGIDLTVHISNVISALRVDAAALGLNGA